jgi:tRNA A-37 threonylcarbamoyl transferase component Bud32
MQRGQQLGPFIIEKELGAGAMGAVYRAKHSESGVRVAIKVMAPGLMSNKTSLDRFQREANILKQLKHPNIVRLLATGKYQGSPFYAMEYVQGESLDHVMARRGRITWEEVVTLGQQLCAALQHVHDRGIVHRDLKPSNIMVLQDGTVKLTDFGIAKDLDVTALTAANCTVGTASYMSPEQCRGDRDISHKSDLYSMGVMFYELLTGRKPFIAESVMEMFTLHVSGTFERPSRIVLEIPMWLDTLVAQLMEKKPDDRPISAAAVAEALGRIKEKVEAQQSAGVELARGRSMDHPKRRGRLDEEDKEAARTLLGKKKKKKVVPFHKKRWVQGVGIVLALLAMGSIIYSAFKPASPEILHAQAKDLMKKKDYRAALGPIQQYLDRYGDRDEKETAEIRHGSHGRRGRRQAENGEGEMAETGELSFGPGKTRPGPAGGEGADSIKQGWPRIGEGVRDGKEGGPKKSLSREIWQ